MNIRKRVHMGVRRDLQCASGNVDGVRRPSIHLSANCVVFFVLILELRKFTTSCHAKGTNSDTAIHALLHLLSSAAQERMTMRPSALVQRCTKPSRGHTCNGIEGAYQHTAAKQTLTRAPGTPASECCLLSPGSGSRRSRPSHRNCSRVSGSPTCPNHVRSAGPRIICANHHRRAWVAPFYAWSQK